MAAGGSDEDFDFGGASSASPTSAALPPTLSSILLHLQQGDIWDPVLWRDALIQLRSVPAASARPIYERFLKLFPTSAKYWRQYAEHEWQVRHWQQCR